MILGHSKMMMNYKLIRPALFLMDPEFSHNFILKIVKLLHNAHVLSQIVPPSPSCPTPGLRDLQGPGYLDSLLTHLKKAQQNLANQHHKYVPILIKISPDCSEDEISQMAKSFSQNQIDGVIATNTTLDRSLVQDERQAEEEGGLSGQPLFQQSTQVLKILRSSLKKDIPIIASGGVMTSIQAKEKTLAGADLIQLYTGLIYRGPHLIAESIKALSELYLSCHSRASA
jgi:dihydroorotate dehydrogenase